jgi:hypothetical protein
MPDHFHLILKTPEANLVAGMQWLLGTYTSRYNVRHGLRGHLFAGRYKATPIDPGNGYLQTALDYVHLIPARANLIQADQPLREFPWSSFGSYLEPIGARKKGPVAGPEVTAFHARDAGRKSARDFERHMESRRTLDLDEEFQGLRHGWYFGAKSFRAELLARMDSTPTANHIGPEIHESAEAKAERVVTRELAQLDWSEQELRERAKGDLAKIRIAEQLRLESTMTLGWIAARLRMGTVGHLSHLLYWRRRGAKPGKRGSAGFARASIPPKRSESKSSRADPPEIPPVTPEVDELSIPSTDLHPFTFDLTFD